MKQKTALLQIGSKTFNNTFIQDISSSTGLMNPANIYLWSNADGCSEWTQGNVRLSFLTTVDSSEDSADKKGS